MSEQESTPTPQEMREQHREDAEIAEHWVERANSDSESKQRRGFGKYSRLQPSANKYVDRVEANINRQRPLVAEHLDEIISEAKADAEAAGVEVNPASHGEPKKIELEQTRTFEREGFTGHVYIESEARQGFNALLIDVHGRHPRKRMVDTTRSYLVIEGEGRFTLGSQTSEVKKGDLFVIPPGGEYEYEGNMQLFEFNVSPENSFKDEKLE